MDQSKNPISFTPKNIIVLFDSMLSLTHRCVSSLLFMFAFLSLVNQPVYAQEGEAEDSTAVQQSSVLQKNALQKNLPADHTPGRVLTRALLVPGWGQIYNRQYWKAAIYYGALGGGMFLVFNANDNYLLYRHAAIYAEYRDVDPDMRPDAYRDHFVNDYNEILLARLGRTENDLSESEQITQRQSLAPQLRRFRDQFRRRRDLNIVFSFAIWGLGVIESFVSAHLLHFDVSDNLSLHVVPGQTGTSAVLTFSY